MRLGDAFQLADQEIVEPLAGGFVAHGQEPHRGACAGARGPYNPFH
jgi:hypothetical protein